MISASGSSQNDSAFRRGNAMSGAPSISGITKLPSPANTGTKNVNTINVPCCDMKPL